jgi:sugar transferase (PEP-CTERM system associated)
VSRGLQLRISSLPQLLCALGEGLIVLAAFVLAMALRFGDDFLLQEAIVPRALTAVFVILVCLYYSDMYEDSALRGRLQLFIGVARAFVVSMVLLSLVYYAVPDLGVGRGVLGIFFVLALAGALGWRFAVLWTVGRSALSDRVIVLGTGQSAQQVAREMLKRRPVGFQIVGFLGEHPAEVGRRLVNPSVIGTIDELEAMVERHDINLIVVALDDRRGILPVDPLLRCRLAGIRVEEATNFFERLTGRILVSNLRPSWLVFSQGFNKPRLLRNSKRAFELATALVMVALSAPLLAVIAVLVKLTSAGPVFYRQERVGEKGRTYFLYKFRTMRINAETETGPVWAAETGDPRITPVGRLLRKTRLDELPQLFNVVRGEMSFVGPRPERPHFVRVLRKVIPFYDERHSVRPGITGWAQIKFRYGSTIEDAEEKLQFDLYYIKHMSLAFDLGILLDTLKVMVLQKGAR